MAALLFRRFALWYDARLQGSPLLTKTVSAVSLAMAADVTCQHMLKTAEEGGFDYGRTVRMGLFTGLMMPAVHQWYILLSRVRHPLARMAVDQLIWAPPGTYAFFLAMGTMRSGGDVSVGIADANSKWRQALYANWAVWPAVQAVNFSIVPLRYNVLFVNFFAFFWSIFMSELAAAPVGSGGEGDGALAVGDRVAGAGLTVDDGPHTGDNLRHFLPRRATMQ